MWRLITFLFFIEPHRLNRENKFIIHLKNDRMHLHYTRLVVIYFKCTFSFCSIYYTSIFTIFIFKGLYIKHRHFWEEKCWTLFQVLSVGFMQYRMLVSPFLKRKPTSYFSLRYTCNHYCFSSSQEVNSFCCNLKGFLLISEGIRLVQVYTCILNVWICRHWLLHYIITY